MSTRLVRTIRGEFSKSVPSRGLVAKLGCTSPLRNEDGREMRIPIATVSLLVFGMAPLMGPASAQVQGSCGQIRAACQEAGFVQGGAREGIGLQVHCVMPIMQARAQPLTARKSLPKVNPQLVANCKVSNSRFGQPGLRPSQALAQPLSAPPTPSGFADRIGN